MCSREEENLTDRMRDFSKKVNASLRPDPPLTLPHPGKASRGKNSTDTEWEIEGDGENSDARTRLAIMYVNTNLREGGENSNATAKIDFTDLTLRIIRVWNVYTAEQTNPVGKDQRIAADSALNGPEI